MANTSITDTFGEGLEKLIQSTLKAKTSELTKREKELEERERIVNEMVDNVKCSEQEIIELRVGQIVYHVTAKTLLKHRDSYFYAMLNSEATGERFIDRDGSLFKYVLEYLRYGKVSSTLTNSQAEKLKLDSVFYNLPGLVQDRNENLEAPKDLPKSVKFVSTSGGTNANLNWNYSNMKNTKFAHCLNDTITVVQPGMYLFFIRSIAKGGDNDGHILLNINGNPVARSRNTVQAGGYFMSLQISEVFNIDAGAALTVFQHAAYGASNEQYGNVFTIVKL